MTYYTVNERTGLIMESSDICPDPQEEANRFGDPVWIIEGQHTGLTASPQTPEEQAAPPVEIEDVADKLKIWEASAR